MNTHEHAATVTICTNAEHVRSHVLDLACRNLTENEREFVNASDGLADCDVDSLVDTYIDAMGKCVYNAGDDIGIEINDKTDKHFQNWNGGKFRGYYHISQSGSTMAIKLAADAIDAAESNMARMLGNYALGMIEEERAFRAKEAL